MEFIFGALYWVAGYLVVLYVAARSNNGLCIFDLIASAVIAFIWPVVLFIIGLMILATEENALTKPRWFTDQR